MSNDARYLTIQRSTLDINHQICIRFFLRSISKRLCIITTTKLQSAATHALIRSLLLWRRFPRLYLRSSGAVRYVLVRRTAEILPMIRLPLVIGQLRNCWRLVTDLMQPAMPFWRNLTAVVIPPSGRRIVDPPAAAHKIHFILEVLVSIFVRSYQSTPLQFIRPENLQERSPKAPMLSYCLPKVT